MRWSRGRVEWVLLLVATGMAAGAQAQLVELGTEFQINVVTVGQQTVPAVSGGGVGGFVVVWQSPDATGSGVFGRRVDSAGNPVGGEFQVNAYVTNEQISPSVARRSNGEFIVAWNSSYQDGHIYGVFGRRFDASASPFGAEFQVNVFTADDQFLPGVVRNPNGDFVVVWYSDMQDGDLYGVFARPFNREAQPRGGELPVNTTTASSQRFARVGGTANHFLFVWQSSFQDGDANGIFGRRFRLPLTLDVDGDGAVRALTDSLLILRYNFGLRGASLVSGAVDPACTRCDAPSIEAYLGSI